MNGEDAEGHRLRVVDIGQEHVVASVHIELEVALSHLKVKLWHRVIVAVVAIA